MSTTKRPTRVLFVINRLDIVTSVVRGLQFRPYFAADPEYQAKYMVRTPPWLWELSRRWPQRPRLRWPMDWFSRLVIRWRESRIAAAAKRCDVVYLLTVPSYGLHRRLRRQHSTVVLEIVDGLWLPWFRQFGWGRLEDMPRISTRPHMPARTIGAFILSQIPPNWTCLTRGGRSSINRVKKRFWDGSAARIPPTRCT
jgi:hypothetical protein